MTLSPIPDEQWPRDIQDMLSGFAGKLNVYRVMAHHPGLLRSWQGLRQHVVLENALPAQLQEMAILRVAHRAGATYEWTHHVSRGRAAGLSDARIDAARAAPGAWAAGELDTYILSAVDDLMDERALSDQSLSQLTAAVGTTGVLDLMATVGMYITLAFIVKTFAVPLETRPS